MRSLTRILCAAVKVDSVPLEPLEAHGRTITAVARSIRVSLGCVGFVCSWPSEIRLGEGGGESHLRIVDVTRVAQVVLIGSASFLALLILTGTRHRKGQRNG